ncbi:MAG: hypothetical protein WAU07_01325 [Microgenomates group bacterium]
MQKLTLAIFVILLSGAGFFVIKNQKETIPMPLPITPTQRPIASIAPTSTTGEDSGIEDNTYRDQNGIFSVVYPNDYTLDIQDPLHIRIYKRGETQRPQSEMSDGALMVFETVDLQGIPIESWVDARIQESTYDGTSEILEVKKSITLNGNPGFQYSIRGLGVSQNLILQKDADSDYAVVITYAISDPQQRGYQEEIDLMLASLKFTK